MPSQWVSRFSTAHQHTAIHSAIRCHQQAAKGDERGRSSCQWHWHIIWLWTEDNITRRAPLAGCPWEDWIIISLVWWCIGTSLITSSQPLMLLLAVFVYDPLTWIVSLYIAADLAHTVRLSGFLSRCPTVWNSLLDKLRNLDSSDSFKRFLNFSAVTSVTSASVTFTKMR